MTLALVVAIGILAFLFLYFCFQIDDQHFLMKLLLIFFFLSSIILLPRAVLEDECYTHIINETTINNVTSYNYNYTCYDKTPTTVTNSFTKIPLWFFRLFITYFSIYLFYFWVKKNEKLMSAFGGGR